MWFISYWFWPVFSSLVWLAMLVTMLSVWSVEGHPHYSSMGEGQRIAFISDIGAQGLKPLFIAMSTVTVVSFDISFILERWARHTGRLTRNTSIWQKVESGLSIVAAIAGAAGLILLSIFDTLRHPKLHDGFLVLFLGGYIVSAIFICWEYQRLGIHYREHSVLRTSFWIKLAFIIVEVALAVAFGVCSNQGRLNTAAVLEWIVAFIYFFYVLSYFLDFTPALRTKHHQSHETEMQQAEAGGAGGEGDYYRGESTSGLNNGYSNGAANGYANGYTNGANAYTDGHGVPVPKPVGPVAPSRNF